MGLKGWVAAGQGSSRYGYLLWLLGWGAAAYASLAVYLIPCELEHALCGPWG